MYSRNVVFDESKFGIESQELHDEDDEPSPVVNPVPTLIPIVNPVSTPSSKKKETPNQPKTPPTVKSTRSGSSHECETETEDEFQTPQAIPVISRPKRNIRKPVRYNDYEMCNENDNDNFAHFAFNASAFIDNVPSSYEDVMGRPDEAEWRSSINEEMKSLNENQTWSIVPSPSKKVKLIGSRWIFKLKKNEESVK